MNQQRDELLYGQQEQAVTQADLRQVHHLGLKNWAAIRAREMELTITSGSALTQCLALTDMVGIKVAHALAAPLRQLEILEACGRIVLISCAVRDIYRDLILPIALCSLGARYESAFCAFSRRVERYYDNPRWWREAEKLCNKTLVALAKVGDRLTRSELAYLTLKLQTPLAWPTGAPRTTNKQSWDKLLRRCGCPACRGPQAQVSMPALWAGVVAHCAGRPLAGRILEVPALQE